MMPYKIGDIVEERYLYEGEGALGVIVSLPTEEHDHYGVKLFRDDEQYYVNSYEIVKVS